MSYWRVNDYMIILWCDTLIIFVNKREQASGLVPLPDLWFMDTVM